MAQPSEDRRPTIQAIETRYRGYRFRSRLEARWAVFFDKLNLPWQYEPQGYHLSDGRLYLPDFHLPTVQARWTGMGLYAEIKGATPTEEEEDKVSRFAADKCATVALLVGDVFNDQRSRPSTSYGHFEHSYRGPWVDENGETHTHEDPRFWDNYMVFMKCYTCGAIKFEFSESNYCYCNHRGCGQPADEDHPDLINAVKAARSARFEHGETP